MKVYYHVFLAFTRDDDDEGILFPGLEELCKKIREWLPPSIKLEDYCEGIKIPEREAKRSLDNQLKDS